MEVDLKPEEAFQAFVSFFVSALYEAQTQICHLAGKWAGKSFFGTAQPSPAINHFTLACVVSLILSYPLCVCRWEMEIVEEEHVSIQTTG